MADHAKYIARCKRLIPPLSPDLHKGQAGRIGVLGGSKECVPKLVGKARRTVELTLVRCSYSGAPYFASMTTLRMGADLAHVICEPAAGNIIKTYSPDLIVHTDLHEGLSEEEIRDVFTSLMPRLHTLVVGPGCVYLLPWPFVLSPSAPSLPQILRSDSLGREKHMQLAARIAIKLARENDLYIVIDADGLFLVQNDPSVVKGYKRAVLTPNVVEFGRLAQACNLDKDLPKNELAAAISRALDGPTIFEKGRQDRITNGYKTLVNEVPGSSRRCGGQGDVLSGAVGTFLAWGKNYEEREAKDEDDPIPPEDITLYAAYGAATMTRTASRLTFADYKRAMQTGEMLGYVGRAFEETFGSDSVTDQSVEGKGVLGQVGGLVDGLKKSIL
ncbi:SPOSA6832_04986 [Sporobolomyces salmonicolor]|uniref:ATP-dependent (S)-NAD(P)H-hydrate dehydratase n=1 Tax=Sporidiobolus salmonicolor TaxID=5005 RepID=A0A0D6ET02_SPOSA|nr:SPOSA6832_04986 [Sporobolomyces salmonicolor]